MPKFISAACLGLCMTASVAAGPAIAGTRILTAADMDRVTAGAATIGFEGVALGTGKFAFTSAGGGGAAVNTSIPGGGAVQSGAGGATASSFTDGGVAATGANSSAAVGGQLLTMTIGGTVGTGSAQASTSFTFASGGTVFLP